MDYQPNVDAVTHFARESLPALRQQVKAASFAIVGRAPTREVLALEAIPGVLVTGEVPDTRPWLAAADVVVAPLKLARGVQNKLLEAMAMAKPIVASSAAAQGIDAQDGQHLLVADGAPATATAVTALLRDPARRSALGMAARERMIARYGWDATMAPLAKMLAMDRAAS
jgi:glycosyltransferase involved in cell wall biosynthesis